jgi:hypothetical protein
MQLDRSVSEGQDESRNTSFLERSTIDNENEDTRFGSDIQSFLTADVYIRNRER